MKETEQKIARELESIVGKRVAVGVSGGRDSMCLIRAMIDSGVIPPSDIIVVHVNHGIRKTAARDENFVRGFCEKNGLAFRLFSVDAPKESQNNGLGLEQAARNLRYDALLSLVKSGEADVVLTAHHALDNVESVLMHIFRGAGLDGLKTMSSPRVLRPMINVYPEELDEYCREKDIEFVVDETNFELDADRNFIRHKVLPLIEERYKGAAAAVNALSREATGACEFLDGALDLSLISVDRGAALIACSALESPLAERYVRYALKTHFTLTDVTRNMIENTVALSGFTTGKTVPLCHGLEAARERSGVAIYVPREECTAEYPFVLGTNYIDGLAVDAKEQPVDDPKRYSGRAVDLDKLVGATIRFRRDGDVFTPFGGNKKKLKDYFIDKKIPKRIRSRIPLVCMGSEVLVAVGIEISDKVKISPSTLRSGTIVGRYS